MRIWHLTSLSVAYIGQKSRMERPRKTKIGTEVAHVTRDSDTTLRSKGQRSPCRGRGHIVAASHTACYILVWGHVCKKNCACMHACVVCSGAEKMSCLCIFTGARHWQVWVWVRSQSQTSRVLHRPKVPGSGETASHRQQPASTHLSMAMMSTLWMLLRESPW